MVEQSLQRLHYLCTIIPPLLKSLSEDEYSNKPAPDKWSKKEILGHLIDSATNNHQRFIRVQFEQVPTITYNQNHWNHFSYHRFIISAQLITFWEVYNRQFVELISHIPKAYLTRECCIGKQVTMLLLNGLLTTISDIWNIISSKSSNINRIL